MQHSGGIGRGPNHQPICSLLTVNTTVVVVNTRSTALRTTIVHSKYVPAVLWSDWIDSAQNEVNKKKDINHIGFVKVPTQYTALLAVAHKHSVYRYRKQFSKSIRTPSQGIGAIHHKKNATYSLHTIKMILLKYEACLPLCRKKLLKISYSKGRFYVPTRDFVTFAYVL